MATHNRHLFGSSGHREWKRHRLDLRSVFTFHLTDHLTLDENLPSVLDTDVYTARRS
jgi:hypothetical protein